MDLADWWKQNKAGRKQLVDKIGSSLPMMRQIVYGHKQAGPKRAIEIEQAIAELTPDSIVTRAEIRPDLW